MNKLEEFEKKLAALALELEAMKAEVAQDEEWPKSGAYYTVLSDNRIENCLWNDDSYDKFRLSAGNVHRTNEEAEAYREWLTNPRTQARRRAEMCDGFDPFGNYQIVVTDRLVKVKELPTDWFTGSMRFTTVKKARSCIEALGDAVIKLALGIGDVK